MRVSLKKVIVFVYVVCVIYLVTFCIYVSTNHDKRPLEDGRRWTNYHYQRDERTVHVESMKQLLKAASDLGYGDQQNNRPYFMNEPHFERLIKQYRKQEEFPMQVLFNNAHDNNEQPQTNFAATNKPLVEHRPRPTSNHPISAESQRIRNSKFSEFKDSKSPQQIHRARPTEGHPVAGDNRGSNNKGRQSLLNGIIRPSQSPFIPSKENSRFTFKVNEPNGGYLNVRSSIENVQLNLQQLDHPVQNKGHETMVRKSELKQPGTHLIKEVRKRNNVNQNFPPVLPPLESKQQKHSVETAMTNQNRPVYVQYINLPNNRVQIVPNTLILNGVQELGNQTMYGQHVESSRVLSPTLAKKSGNPLDKSACNISQFNLSDVYLAVKTTKKFHRSRLQILLDTWVSVIPNQVHFFTDGEDEEFQIKTNGHMINTHCPDLHVRAALCCKMAAMFDKFIESNKSWFCHVDDDNYLNFRELRKLLDMYHPLEQEVYLGRSSTLRPIEAYDSHMAMKKEQFWFGTGGAGVCLSRALAKKMIPFISGGRMVLTCERIRMPDDVTIGYINEILLNVTMLHIKQMNSHLQELWAIKQNDVKNQITLSYQMDSTNKLSLHNPMFTLKEDPTRFKSIHCILYPSSSICPASPP